MMQNLILFAGLSNMPKHLLSLAPVDWLIIGIYFVVVIGIGFYLKRFAGTGEDFFMAGRKMTAWVAGLSFISANLSALETMGWSAQTYQYGLLAAHSYWFNAVPAIIFLAVVMMPFYYICKTHSVPGYLQLRYDSRSSVLGGISFAFMTIMVSGASMFAMATILHLLLGWNMDVSIWTASLTVAVYVTMAGLISAVFNEVVQFFLIWLGTLLIPILGIIDAGGWTKMVETIQRNVQVIHPTLHDANFTCLWRNLGSFDNPMGVDWFGIALGFSVSGFAYWCTDFLQVQRVMVAKNLRAAQNGTLIGAVLKMCVPFIVILPGLLGLAVLTNPDNSPMVLVPENDPRANITLHTYNQVLPLLMGKYLGPGLLGLGVTAMIAGFMSGMAGNVSAFATVWTYDVYKPLFNRNASDHHYLNMGRWCSVLGVIFSIGTAYLLFYFSNILEFFQALGMFFLLPLFGVIILGMMWKRCTPAGGFWGFLIAILASVAMFILVHSFPDGYRPSPQIVLNTAVIKGVEVPLVVNLEKETVKSDKAGNDTVKIVKVIVESGKVEITNVPLNLEAGQPPFVNGETTIKDTAAELPKSVVDQAKKKALDREKETSKTDAAKEVPTLDVRVLAPEVVLAKSKEKYQFGAEGVQVVLKPGVQVAAHDVTQYFNPGPFNPDYAKIVARSEKAKPIAVYIYCSLWTFLISVVVAVAVSLFTKPKADVDLKDLVMGLTKMPDEGPCAWYEKPKLWAVVVVIVLATLNIIFW
jgi:SSS family solute:Na+ symporter